MDMIPFALGLCHPWCGSFLPDEVLRLLSYLLPAKGSVPRSVLPRASAPSSCRECVETLFDGSAVTDSMWLNGFGSTWRRHRLESVSKPPDDDMRYVHRIIEEQSTRSSAFI